MKRILFSKAIELFSGRIGLTDTQAQVRTHSLKPVGKGVYEITGKIEFKAGESIELESIPKGLAAPVVKEPKPPVEKDAKTDEHRTSNVQHRTSNKKQKKHKLEKKEAT